MNFRCEEFDNESVEIDIDCVFGSVRFGVVKCQIDCMKHGLPYGSYYLRGGGNNSTHFMTYLPSAMDFSFCHSTEIHLHSEKWLLAVEFIATIERYRKGVK